MKIGVLVGLTVGLLMTLGLLIYFGWTAVGQALGHVGWLGLAEMTVIHLPSLALCGLAWHQSTLNAPAGSRRLFVLARWIRDSAASVIAILPISGELAGVRVLNWMGLGIAGAAASIVVDITMELTGQFLFTLTGLVLLFLHNSHAPILYGMTTGLLAAVPMIIGFFLLQRFGTLRWVEGLSSRLASTLQWPLLRGAESMQAALHATYQRPRQLSKAVALHVLAWFVGAAETWLGLFLLGYRWSLWQVLVVESLVYALRTAIFIIPNGIGVQESGYVMAGALFGLNPQSALALSILKRGRELVVAIPGLITWQAMESGTLWSSGKECL